MAIGHRKWCLPDLYLKPPYLPATPSHESISLANFGERPADVTVCIVFEGDTAPVKIEGIQVGAMRSARLRMDQLSAYGCTIPTEVPYSVLLESSENIVVGYGRLNWIEGHMQSFGGVGYFED